eukprot:2846157-Prymnesium_polylepis.1
MVQRRARAAARVEGGLVRLAFCWSFGCFGAHTSLRCGGPLRLRDRIARRGTGRRAAQELVRGAQRMADGA